MYTINDVRLLSIDQDTAERTTQNVLRKIRKNTTDVGVMEACSVLLIHLKNKSIHGYHSTEMLSDYTDEFQAREYCDSGFTDDFGVHME